MDEHFEELRFFLFEADLKRRRDVVHFAERQIVAHRAVTGKVEVPTDALEHKIVDIQDLMKPFNDCA
jgi:hypothetical protein